jgi:hypothetical protein
MATKKKKSSPSKANRKAKGGKKSKKNGGVSLATVKAMFSKKKSKKTKSKGNPSFMGMRATEIVGDSLAVALAVTGAKLLPPMFPAGWVATDLGRFLTTLGVSAGQVVATHFLFPKYTRPVMLGGGAQTLSVGLNPILRHVSSNITLGRIRQRRGMADFVNANFPEPHNPIYNRMITSGMATTPGAMGPVSAAGVGKYQGRFN